MKRTKLTIFLSVVLVCLLSFGIFALSAQAEEGTPVPFAVGEGDSLADVLTEVENYGFAAGEYAKITLSGEHVAEVKGGVLFGLSDLGVPVVLEGGSLVLPEGTTGAVSCTNDYTFRGMTFALAGLDVDFYTGANAVVFDTVSLGSGSAAEFFADSVAGEGSASLTFKATDYAGTVYAAGAENGAAIAESSLTVDSSEVATVGIRKAGASASVKKVTVNITGTSKVTTLLAAGEAVGQEEEGYVFDVAVNLSGGTVTTLHGGDGAGKVTKLTNALSGGTVTSFYGTGARGVYGTVTNSLSGGSVGIFYGTGNQTADGALTVSELKNDFLGTTLPAASNKVFGTGDAEIVNATHSFTKSKYTSGGKGYFYGTAAAFANGGDVTGTLKHIVKANNRFFHTYYVTSAKISGKLDVEFNVGGTSSFGLCRLSMKGGAGSVEYDLNKISGYLGECNLVGGVIDGDVVVNVNETSASSYYRILSGAKVGGNVDITIRKLTKTGATRPLQLVGGTSVAGKVKNTLIDCTLSTYVFCATGSSVATSEEVDGKDVDRLYASNAASFGSVENVFQNCTATLPIHCLNGSISGLEGGQAYVKNTFEGGSYGKIFGTTNGVGTAALPVSVENSLSGVTLTEVFYGTGGVFHKSAADTKKYDGANNDTTGSALVGNVTNTAQNSELQMSFNGAAGAVTGNVTNTVTDVTVRQGFNGVHAPGKTVTGKVTNVATRLTMPENKTSYWFQGVFGSEESVMTVGGVENQIEDSEISYFRGNEHCLTVKDAEGNVIGDVINKWKNSSCRGAFYASHHGGARNVTTTAEGCTFNAAFYGANGSASGAITATLTNCECLGSGVYANNGNALATLTISDCTVLGKLWPNDDKATNRKPRIVLAGDLTVGAASSLTVSSFAKGVENVDITMTEPWVNGQTYVTTVRPADLDKITVLEIEGGVAGAAGKDASGAEGVIRGVVLNENAMVSLTLAERIRMNVWLSAAEVDGIMAAQKAPLTLTGMLAGEELCDLTLDADALAKTEVTADGYYKIPVSVIHAGGFGNEISMVAEIGNESVVLNKVGDKALTVLNLARAGYENCKAYLEEHVTDATDEEWIAYTVDRDLFAAIYNYGASVAEGELIPMENFVKDLAEDPVSGIGKTSEIEFQRLNLLMGDAIGIRLVGTVKTSSDLTVKVNGEVTDCYSKRVEGDTVFVDLYVSLKSVAEELDIVVETASGIAARVKTCVKGYSEAVASRDTKTLALAQLAQAAYNRLNPPTQAERPAAPAVNPLHGKKVIFVGNSYTYYGNCVIPESNVYTTDYSARAGDHGYFYQLCKANGADVSVTNWTYGSHGIGDLFDGCTITSRCAEGYDHTKDLDDAVYDYVFLQDRSGEEYTTEQVLDNVEKAAAFFREANPDVKIFFFAQSRLYEWNVGWLPALDAMADMGVTVIRWGALVEDVIAGRATVEGSELTYNRNSFIISQSTSDGYHPNMLSGYLTALMAYCAVTEESAVGQPYAFCTDSTVESAFNADTYITKYYKNGATTNMKEIFNSPTDMAGLQALADQYL